jgi:hypothetical protein
MLLSFIQSLFRSRESTYRDLLKFVEIEYKKENRDYTLSLINSGQIFKN